MALLGIAFFTDSIIAGIIVLLLGALALANCFTTTFLISNNAGQKEGYQLSVLEKNSIREFVDKINNTVAGV